MSKLKPTKKLKIGSRVRWWYGFETGTGTLMALDCDTTSTPHLVQREDGMGRELEKSDTSPWYKNARKQGVKNGTKNLMWVSRVEPLGHSKTVQRRIAIMWKSEGGKHKHKFNQCVCGEKKV